MDIHAEEYKRVMDKLYDILEEVEANAFNKSEGFGKTPIFSLDVYTSQILNIKGLAILADDLSLPDLQPYDNFEQLYGKRPSDIVFIMGQKFREQDILEANFRRII